MAIISPREISEAAEWTNQSDPGSPIFIQLNQRTGQQRYRDMRDGDVEWRYGKAPKWP
jgi:hypothetical protein